MPPGVVTITLAGPAGPAGVTALIPVAPIRFTLVADTPPMETLGAPIKPYPVIVTSWFPSNGPSLGLTFDTVGIGA